MFPALDESLVPLRLSITAVIPPDPTAPVSITITCDPPSDRYAVMWYSDTITDVLTQAEMCEAVYAMLADACQTINRGVLYEVGDLGFLPGCSEPETPPPHEQLTLA